MPRLAHQMLAMRAASIRTASTSARQTSDVQRSSRLSAGREMARTFGGLRIRYTRGFRALSKKERPRRFRGLLQAQARNTRLLERVVDVRELGIEVAAEAVDHGNDR